MSYSSSARRVAVLALLALLVAPGALASEALKLPPNCEGKRLETRVLEIKFKPLGEAAALVGQLLGPCGTYRVPKALGVVAIEDEREILDRVSEALASWDVPPPVVEVSVSLVLATRDAPPAGGIAEELRDVSETLSRVTRWTNYERIGSATLRIAEGSRAEADLGERYRVAFRVGGVDPDRGIVHLEPFDLLRMPHPNEAASGLRSPRLLLANSALNVFEGRPNFVGAPSRTRDRAIFLALEVWTGAAALDLEETKQGRR